ncbi:hypothetical protein [Shewanella colwelliana]|uniref:tellurite resistance TerB family protein n=1 Tax=Shewanella colwelliana TaxID=23 RepID=UPI00048C9264|nr:hypothetical protein [Shewanella colwelliana]
MDMLNLFTAATQEAEAFAGHPVADENLEAQILYLQGLAMVMNADGERHTEELEYLRILLKSFQLDDSLLDSLCSFAVDPDKDTIQAFVGCYRRQPLAQLFLFDALMLSYRDGEMQASELALIHAMAEKLEILPGTQNDIKSLFGYIRQRNWDESAVYLASHLLNPDHFRHLLDYHGVEMDELLQSLADTGKPKLRERVEALLDVNLTAVRWTALKKQPIYSLSAKQALVGHQLSRVGSGEFDKATCAQLIKKGEPVFEYWLSDSNITFGAFRLAQAMSHRHEAKVFSAPMAMSILAWELKGEGELGHAIASILCDSPETLAENVLIAIEETDRYQLLGGLNAKSPVSYSALLQQGIMLPYLQSLLARRQVRIVGQALKKTHQDAVYCQLSRLGIGYDQLSDSLYCLQQVDTPYTQEELPVELLNDFCSLIF